MIKDCISVIIPVYNCEKYLKRCLESIINQTYTNIQVIVIDDGSSDNSPFIIEEYIKKDKRIEGHFKKNGGVSSARNIGLEYVKGEYVSFIDSDDYLNTDMYEIMMKYFGRNVDLVTCGVDYVTENGIPIKSIKIDEGYLSREDALKELLLNRKLIGALWNCLIRTQCLKDKFFNINYAIGEDFYYKYFVFKSVRGIYCINNSLYNYCISGSNVMSRFDIKKWVQAIDISQKVLEDIEKDKEKTLESYAKVKCFESALYILKQCNGVEEFYSKEFRKIEIIVKKYLFSYLSCKEIGIFQKVKTLGNIIKVYNSKFINRRNV